MIEPSKDGTEVDPRVTFRKGNPFADVVSVEPYDIIDDDEKFKEFDGMSLETADEEMVEVTIRIPEQFFTESYPKADWEASLYATQSQAPGFGVDYLIDTWSSDIDVEQELYGPDGQQVPLW